MSESRCEFFCFLYRFDLDPDLETRLYNNTDEDVNLRGKHMHFLKDRECDNGRNHSTQGDCRAKAPININETSVLVGILSLLSLTLSISSISVYMSHDP